MDSVRASNSPWPVVEPTIVLRVAAAAFPVVRTLRPESVVSAVGTVSSRPEGMVNKDQVTGDVEVDVQDLTLLNSCRPLPFTVRTSCHVLQPVSFPDSGHGFSQCI